MFWYIFNRFKSEMKLIEYLLNRLMSVYLWNEKFYIYLFFK